MQIECMRNYTSIANQKNDHVCATRASSDCINYLFCTSSSSQRWPTTRLDALQICRVMMSSAERGGCKRACGCMTTHLARMHTWRHAALVVWRRGSLTSSARHHLLIAGLYQLRNEIGDSIAAAVRSVNFEGDRRRDLTVGEWEQVSLSVWMCS